MRKFEELCPREDLKKNPAVRNTIIQEYAPLIKFVATRIHYGLPATIELDDLISIGALGLIDAIDKYDTHRGVLFKTYAESRIRGKILDELRKLDWLPRGLRQKNKALDKAYQKLGVTGGKDCTDEELAEELGIDAAEVPQYISQATGYTMLSLDEQVYDKDGSESGSLADILPDRDGSSPEEQTEMSQYLEVLKRHIGKLNDKEQQVLALYYYEELTMKEIGSVLDITESRVSQIHSQALFKLKKAMERL
ncbi:FliA/WhiG family RNA polymerase sigma factor [Desulfurispira natronophila]|uniref:RNA polymerase sigma factor n=1 Tax=Desulfurispira natronophila TaxID=682562 RepID=A0A7W7Y3J0_9BACT|nr:FliA/WhiG family RNA polymerase sigma factor [Desulfurispira natronophila]MBB5021425.1 RNA polymerase sigma factor for flagellar operon FliA [Desulfurispira natronophila]